MYSDKAEGRDQLQILFLEDGTASEPRLRTARCVWLQEMRRLPPISEKTCRGCGAPKGHGQPERRRRLGGPQTKFAGSRSAGSARPQTEYNVLCTLHLYHCTCTVSQVVSRTFSPRVVAFLSRQRRRSVPCTLNGVATHARLIRKPGFRCCVAHWRSLWHVAAELWPIQEAGGRRDTNYHFGSRVHARAGMAKACMVFGTDELAMAQVRCAALDLQRFLCPSLIWRAGTWPGRRANRSPVGGDSSASRAGVLRSRPSPRGLWRS